MLSKIFNGVCLFVAVAAVAYIYFGRKPTSTPNAEKLAVEVEAKVISRKLDRLGLEHTVIEETANRLPKGMFLAETGYDVAYVDSLISVTDIQKKQIISLMSINQTIQAEKLQAVQVIDKYKKRIYEYQDSNLYVSYTPDIDSAKAGMFGYKFNQDLNIISYNKKKWLLGRDRYLMDISSTSKYSTINSVKKLTIPLPEKSFNIRLTAKSVYMPVNGNYGVGASIKLKVDKVSVTGSQLYFPRSQKWIPVPGVEFDLLNY
jgi:hypothetical protein